MPAVTPYVSISQAGAGSSQIAAAIAGQKIRLRSIAGFLSAAGTVQLKDTDGTALSGAMNIGTTGGPVWPDNSEGWVETASGKGLNIVSVTGAFNGVASVQYVPG